MSNPKTPQTTKKKETAIEPAAPMLPANIGDFTPEEVNTIDSFSQYLGNFWHIKSNLNQFQILDKNNEGQVYKDLPALTGVIVLHAHWVYKLTEGGRLGLQTDYDSWTDAERQVIAKSYGSPFVEPKSQGNFAINGLAAYLQDSEKRKAVSKRLYVYLGFPEGVLPKGQIAVAFLGSTANESFNPLVEQCKAMGAPLPFCRVNITLQQAKSESGKDFFKPHFELAMKDGAVLTSAQNADKYRASIVPVIETLKAAHAEEMERVEKTIMSDSTSTVEVHEVETTEAPIMGAMQDENLPF